MRRLLAAAIGVLTGFLTVAVGTADAEPAPPSPTPGSTSTSDELADMVLDVIEHDAPAVPSTTPLPAPPP